MPEPAPDRPYGAARHGIRECRLVGMCRFREGRARNRRGRLTAVESLDGVADVTAPQQLRLCVLAALVAIMVLDRWGSDEPALAAEDRAVLDRLSATLEQSLSGRGSLTH